MSIEKYTTESLVVSITDIGESDAIFKLYTRDFGLIYAKQNSLRKSVKLRQHLILGRITNVTLVKGKEYWRITGAGEKVLGGFNVNKDLAFRLINMLNRFIQLESKNIKLYDRLIYFCTAPNLDNDTCRLIMLSIIMIVGGFMDSRSLDMEIEEFVNATPDEIYIKTVLNRDRVVSNLRDSVNSSML
jgi:hypothetical protein